MRSARRGGAGARHTYSPGTDCLTIPGCTSGPQGEVTPLDTAYAFATLWRNTLADASGSYPVKLDLLVWLNAPQNYPGGGGPSG